MALTKKPGCRAGIINNGNKSLLKLQMSTSCIRGIGWDSTKVLTKKLVKDKGGSLKKVSVSVAKMANDGYCARRAPTKANRLEAFFPLGGTNFPRVCLGGLEVKRRRYSIDIIIRQSQESSAVKKYKKQLTLPFDIQGELV